MTPRRCCAKEKKKPTFTATLLPKAKAFAKRVSTLKKKSKELSVLCDVDTCMICYFPDGELHHWPENPDDVRQIAMRYKGLSEDKLRKHRVDLADVLGPEIDRTLKKARVGSPASTYPYESIEDLSDDELAALCFHCDSHLVEYHENALKLEVGMWEQPLGVCQINEAEESCVETDVFEGLGDLSCGFNATGCDNWSIGEDFTLGLDPIILFQSFEDL